MLQWVTAALLSSCHPELKSKDQRCVYKENVKGSRVRDFQPKGSVASGLHSGLRVTQHHLHLNLLNILFDTCWNITASLGLC